MGKIEVMIAYNDIPRDGRHGLNQPATRISRPDLTITPAYSAVCLLRAITLSYADTKQCLGPVCDRITACI